VRPVWQKEFAMAERGVLGGSQRAAIASETRRAICVAAALCALIAPACTKLEDAIRPDAGPPAMQDGDASDVTEEPAIAGDGATASFDSDGATASGDDAGPSGQDGGSEAGTDAALSDAGGDAEAPQGDGGRPAEPCTTAGTLRCAAGASREICMNGIWQAGEACPADTVCTMDDPAKCPSLLAACVGNQGKSVCTGSVMQHCNAAALSAGTETCASERLCQLGLEKAHCLKCVPGSFKCTGTQLEKCSDDGERWTLSQTCATAALCNATAGACTAAACTAGQKRCTGDTLERCNAGATGFERDAPCTAGLCDEVGQQCDVCLPRSRRCMGTGSYQVCQESGQGYTTATCASATPYCTGTAGTCVACLNDGNCGDPGECRSASCSAGSCVSSNDRLGSSCRLTSGGTGQCDGAGNCFACLNAGDACTLSGGGTGVCNSSHSCVQCNNDPSTCTTPSINSCEQRTCSAAGQCGKTTRTGTTCPYMSSIGYCTTSARCVECVNSNTCPGERPYCVNNACVRCENDGQCGSGRYCDSNNTCLGRCGNGAIERAHNEDCEVGSGGWTSSNCLMCRQLVYRPYTDPPSGACLVPAGDRVGPSNCPVFGNFTPVCLSIFGGQCAVGCNTTTNCPIGYTCHPFAGTPFELYATMSPFSGYCY
jgi:hypothetical protein